MRGRDIVEEARSLCDDIAGDVDIDGTGECRGSIEIVTVLVDEVKRLQASEQASKSVIQKWAAEQMEMVAEIERLKRGECICTKCGLRQDGDGVAGKF